MAKPLVLPGALFMMNECADQRVFNEQEIAQFESLNEQWSIAKQRIKNMENSFVNSINERKQRAFDEGYQAGLKQSSEKMLMIISQCQAAEQVFSKLAISVINKVLDDLPDDVLLPSLVSCAVKKITESYSYMTVFVHPEFLESVKLHLNQTLAQSPFLKLITVREDLYLNKSDCRIETDLGVVNANLNDQLDAITSVFLEECC